MAKIKPDPSPESIDPPAFSHTSPVDLMNRVYSHRPLVALLNPERNNPPLKPKAAAAYFAEHGEALSALEGDICAYLDLMKRSDPKSPYVSATQSRLTAIRTLKQEAEQA